MYDCVSMVISGLCLFPSLWDSVCHRQHQLQYLEDQEARLGGILGQFCIWSLTTSFLTLALLSISCVKLKELCDLNFYYLQKWDEQLGQNFWWGRARAKGTGRSVRKSMQLAGKRDGGEERLEREKGLKDTGLCRHAQQC